MNQQKHEWPDGAFVIVKPDCSWDLTLPNGTHIRGTAATAEAAIEAASSARREWILIRWERGAMERFPGAGRRAGWCCPLT